MLPGANRASICPQRLKLGIRRLVGWNKCTLCAPTTSDTVDDNQTEHAITRGMPLYRLPNLTQGLRCLLIKPNTYVHIIPCGRVSILFEQEMMVATAMCNAGDGAADIIVNQEDQVVDGEADGSTAEAPIFFVSHGCDGGGGSGWLVVAIVPAWYYTS
uniref:Uncharacterized protein n=1 Tax=Oryza meridionalis TaxID=40149 RepID=A0A0E0EA39_9ORYZ